MKWALVLILTLAFGAQLHGHTAAEQAAHSGLIVKFRAFDPARQDDVHKSVGAVLVYRSQRQRLDALRLRDAKDNERTGPLEKACAVYLTHPEVEGCEPGDRLKPAQSASDDPSQPACRTPVARMFDDAMIRNLTTAINCDPFEPEDLRAARPQVITEEMGAVSPYWAQEATGSDLAAAALNDWDRAHADKTKPVNVGIIDGGIALDTVPSNRLVGSFDNTDPRKDGHGTSVANLILAPVPFGTGTRARLSRAQPTETTADLIRANDRFTTGDNQPQVVNFSMTCRDEKGCSNFSTDTLKGLATKAVLVKAVGNEYPLKPIDPSKLPEAFFVGSTAPNGLLSEFSSEHAEVLVTAPSDHYVASVNAADPRKTKAKAELGQFSGTSGAAPQVTGAITNVLSLVPDMTHDELRALIKQTATRTAGYNPDNGKNGAGQLNAYKMVEVAKKLKAGGWPSNRATISDPALYDFGSEAGRLREQAVSELRSGLCSSARRAAILLRRSFLLDSENPDSRALLAQLYRDQGYRAQALFYERPAAATIVAAIHNPAFRLRAAVRNGVLNAQTYADFAATKDMFETQSAQRLALAQGPTGVLPFIDAALKAGNDELAFGFMNTMSNSHTDGPTVLAVTQRLFRDGGDKIRHLVVFEALRNSALTPEQKLTVFSQAAGDPSVSVRETALSQAYRVHGDRAECLRDIARVDTRGFEQWQLDSVVRARAHCGSTTD